MNARVLLLLCIVVSASSACDPSVTILRSDALAFLREPQIQTCCECLALAEVDVTGPDEGCSTSTTDPVSPCLCDADRARCEEALRSGLPIVVVGACVEAVGPCGDACQDVLAYP